MFILLFFILTISALTNAQQCEDTIEHHLGTKTPYRMVAVRNHSKMEYPGCTPTKIWMLVRHGTRNPSEEYIEVMKTRLTSLKKTILDTDNELIKSQLQLFQKWKITLESDDEKQLTSEGVNEMIELAERMQARFPELLSHIYSNTSYHFKFTHTRRTKASAINFAVGLFGKPTAKSVWYPEPSNKDPILRFYKLCNKWRHSVKKNPKTLQELAKFKRSTLARGIVEEMERKLGLRDGALSFEDLQYMYLTCAFETAWNRKRKSPWCSLFDLNTIRLLEYAEDLKYYWIDGYGYNITYEQACPAFENMFKFLEDPEPYPKATLYFTHSGTLLKMIAHLGLYKDEDKLTHNIINHDRKWKVSKIDPFGTNLAFVSFQCETGTKLLLLHQERPRRFPCCPESDLCNISEIKHAYRNSIEYCHFNEICELATPVEIH